VEIVISNKPAVGALEIAGRYGVKSRVIENAGMTRKEHEEQVVAELQTHDFDFLVLAGYMRVLSPYFLRHFRDAAGFFKVINIHPSLLPAFPGKDAYADAFAAGLNESGITIHLVDEEVDHGPILAQRKFPRVAGDTLETFKSRGLSVEHALFPEVLQRLAKDGLASILREEVRQ
jgi:phosphoribosylglycinamide formyltransferase-1